MIAMLSALFGAAFFLLLATFTSMPVSTTHRCVNENFCGELSIAVSPGAVPVTFRLVRSPGGRCPKTPD